MMGLFMLGGERCTTNTIRDITTVVSHDMSTYCLFERFNILGNHEMYARLQTDNMKQMGWDLSTVLWLARVVLCIVWST